MKKILSALLALLTCFSLISVVPVKAEDLTSKVQSFEIVDFINEFETGKSFNIDVAFTTEVDSYSVSLVFLGENRNLAYIYAENDVIVFDSSLKDSEKNYKFIYFEVLAYKDGECVCFETHSPYSSEEIKNMLGEMVSISPDAKLVKTDKDYSFTLTDSVARDSVISLKNVIVKQNDNKVEVEIESNEDISEMDDVSLQFYNVNEDLGGLTFSFGESKEGWTLEGNKLTFTKLLDGRSYLCAPYGEYELRVVSFSDIETGSYRAYDYDKSKASNIILKKENNEFEKYTKDNFYLVTEYDNNEVVLRKSEPFYTYFLSYIVYNNQYGEEIIKEMLTVDMTQYVDFDTVGTYEVPVTFDFQKNYDSNSIETYKFKVKVHVVEAIGNIIENEFTSECSITLEQFEKESASIFGKPLPKITVKEFNGDEYKRITVKPGLTFKDATINPDGTFDIKVIQFAAYDPRYIKPSELVEPVNSSSANGRTIVIIPPDQLPGMIKVTTIYHIINENGDLVDVYGNVIIPYAERENVEYNQAENNNNVNVSALYGTLPSYTEVSAEEVNDLSDLEDEDYIAYDINLVADYENIQPVGTTDLVIDLPEDLQDGESYVAYHYDDEGNKEEVEVTVENGKAYIKAESFSTYAIVKRKDSSNNNNNQNNNGGGNNNQNNNNTGGNAGNGSGNATGSGSGNASSGTNNNTKAPETGDSTNVAMLMMMLLASAYVLGRKRA